MNEQKKLVKALIAELNSLKNSGLQDNNYGELRDDYDKLKKEYNILDLKLRKSEVEIAKLNDSIKELKKEKEDNSETDSPWDRLKNRLS